MQHSFLVSKMIQVEPFQSWPDYSSVDSYFEDKYAQVGCFEFPSPSISVEDFSIDTSFLLSSPVCDDDHSHNFPTCCDDSPAFFPVEQCLLSLDDVNMPIDEQVMIDELEGLCEWMETNSSPVSQQFFTEEDAKRLNLSPISSEASTDVPILLSDDTSLVLPSENMEFDDQLSILHLMKAYGEATELGQEDLTNELIRRLTEKSSPTGGTLERLAYFFAQAFGKEVDYLIQESSKNYEVTFRAFYQIFPYGRFAHFTANSIILEAIPEDARIIHIVDFDIGHGIQWPPLIEALGRRGQTLVRLTSIKWEEEGCSYFPPMESFEETKKRIYEHARNFGVRLKVEEMDMQGLESEMKRAKERGRRNKWFAFNCIAGLPHMGRLRSIRRVMEFLKVAKDSINNPIASSSGSSRGIITVGNVSEVERLDCSGFGSFFETQLAQLQAFFQSMEWHFPVHLLEARVAMECLFMAPQVSSLAGFQKWEESSMERRALSEIGLKAWRISKDNLVEAKELVREGKSPYWVSSTGENENQMVLGYMGSPLVTVSSWI